MNAAAFSPDPAFPHLATAMDPEAMRGWLTKTLAPSNAWPLAIRDCRLSIVRHRPGERCLVEYLLTLVDGDSGRTWERMVTGFLCSEERARHIRKKLESAGILRAWPGGRPSINALTYIRELHMLVQAYPLDYRLPALARLATHPPAEVLEPMLRRFDAGPWVAERCDIETVRYRAARQAVLRYTLRARNAHSGRVEDRGFYLKVWRKEGGEALYRMLREVSAASRRGRCAFHINTPLAYVPEHKALILGEAAGTSLESVIEAGEDVDGPTRQAADALAALHNSGVTAPDSRPSADGCEALGQAGRLVEWGCPHLGPRIRALLSDLAGRGGSARTALIHGDLKAKHVFLDGQKVTFIDLDELAAGDPLLDVASINADAAGLAIRKKAPAHRIERMTRAFTRRYLERAPHADLGRLQRHYAGALLTRASKTVRRQQPGWRAAVERFVSCAERALAGPPDSHRGALAGASSRRDP